MSRGYMLRREISRHENGMPIFTEGMRQNCMKVKGVDVKDCQPPGEGGFFSPVIARAFLEDSSA